MADNSTKIIIVGVLYLFLFSGMCAYFAREMTASGVTNATAYPEWAYKGPFKGGDTPVVNTTSQNYTTFSNESICLTTLEYSTGDWACNSTVGLYSEGAQGNYAFMTPSRDEMNTTYTNNYVISNPSNLEFDTVIAYHDTFWGLMPPDAIRCEVRDDGFYLTRTDGLTFLTPTRDILAQYLYDGANTLGTYNIETVWDYEDTQKVTCTVNGMSFYSGAMGIAFDSWGETMYNGGVYVDAPGLSVFYHSSLTYSRTMNIKVPDNPVAGAIMAFIDWAGYVLDIFRVLAWQLPESIMPLEIQMILIGVPEIAVALAIASRMLP